MSITTLDHIAAGLRQRVTIRKVGVTGTGGLVWHSSSIVLNGLPNAMSAVSSTTTGAVPVAGDTGIPAIAPFSGDGRIISVEVSSVATATYWLRGILYDRLFHCGPYAFNSTTQTLSSQPSFSGRLPGGIYNGTELWLEALDTRGSGSSATVTVTYTNQSGTGSRTSSWTVNGTGFSTGTNQMVQMPLQAGDSGVQSVDSISSSGTQNTNFNVLIVRRLWMGGTTEQTPLRIDPLDAIGMPTIYPTSAICLVMAVVGAGVSVAGSDFEIEIASG